MSDADVLVVGSGAAGVSAAIPLVEAGLRVAMLEAGEAPAAVPADRPPLAELRTRGGDWRHLLGADLHALSGSSGTSPKLRTRSAGEAVAGYLAANHIHPQGFTALGFLAQGGLTNLWGAAAPTWGAEDLAGYPIGLDDLAPSYRAVAARCGVSGGDDDLAAAPPLELPRQAPPRLTPNMARLHERARAGAGRSGVRIASARNMVLTEPRDGRDACRLESACLWGCARGAVYASGFDLARLQAYDNFVLHAGTRVRRVERDGGQYRIRASAANGDATFRAPRVVLAAGALASTRLAMLLDERLAEGRTLQSSPCAAFALLHPGGLGAALPRESFGLAQLALRVDDGEDGYAFGALFAGECVAAADILARLPLSRRGGVDFLRLMLPALSLGLIYLPGIYSRNRVSLERAAGDDAPGLIVTGELREEAGARFRRVFRRLLRTLPLWGALPLPGSLAPYGPGAEAHYGASLPMGEVLTRDCELRGHDGVFVVDGAALAELPAKHHTFTIMANADRVGRRLARRLHGGAGSRG